MEPTAKAITTKIASGLSGAAKESGFGFIKTVLHAPAEALGGLIADPISARRFANMIKIAAKAKEQLDKAGISPREVPLSIIHPALEAAALEEDEDLQDIWANLLANTADIRQVDVISPSFALILRELRAKDVKFLDSLYRHVEDELKRRQNFNQNTRLSHCDVRFDYFVMRHLYAEFVLSIAKKRRSMEEEVLLSQTFGFSLDLAIRHRLLEIIYGISRGRGRERDVGALHQFSHLGARFVAACRQPDKAS